MNIRNTLYAGAAASLTLIGALRAAPSLAQTTAPPPPAPAASERGPGDGPEPYYRNSLAGQAWRMAHAEARSEAPPPPAPPEAAPPPRPQSIALSRKVVEAAAVFVRYVDNASDLDSDLADGEEVAASVEEGSAYEAHQLAEGAVAYAALVALQDPGFVEGVRSLAADRTAASNLAAQLIARPATAADIPGAGAAGARSSFALARWGQDLQATGRAFRQSAYDVQHQAWSRVFVAHPEERLAAVKAISNARQGLSREDMAEAVQKVVQDDDLRQSRAPVGPPTALIQRGLALAALAVLGEAGEAQNEALGKLMAEPEETDCLNLAKLNLYQCLAVAGPHYEHMFCLGEHSLHDTGQCLVAASGGVGSERAAVETAAVSKPPEDTLSVPVAAFAAARPDQSALAPRTR
ncbi:MAG: hypothetical protein AB1429_07235 [Pseudomonadota bacterium]|jgi:hypothetical protein